MKIARFEWQGTARYGVVEGDKIYSLIGDLFGENVVGKLVCNLAEAKILAPVIPTKVLAVGLNYAAHVAEGLVDRAAPDEPRIFIKPTSSVVGPLEPVIYPKITHAVSYEAELVVVMKKFCKEVSEAEVKDYVLGYTCGNDVSARDIQKRDGMPTMAKSFDTSCPLGPYIVTDIDPNDLRIMCRVNGETRQDSRTSKLIHGVDKIVSFISQVMPLLPGDVVMTGTPEGVGLIPPGSIMEVEIEGIGILRNTLVKPES